MQVPYNLYYGAPIYYPLTKEWSTLSWTHLLSLEQKDYKPDWQLALRGLSDMTEEERWEAGKLFNKIWIDVIVDTGNKNYGKKQSFNINPSLDKFLLSKHFDLFGLIENNLAIDKTKVLRNSF